jgi:hypothetical protein
MRSPATGIGGAPALPRTGGRIEVRLDPDAGKGWGPPHPEPTGEGGSFASFDPGKAKRGLPRIAIRTGTGRASARRPHSGKDAASAAPRPKEGSLRARPNDPLGTGGAGLSGPSPAKTSFATRRRQSRLGQWGLAATPTPIFLWVEVVLRSRSRPR